MSSKFRLLTKIEPIESTQTIHGCATFSIAHSSTIKNFFSLYYTKNAIHLPFLSFNYYYGPMCPLYMQHKIQDCSLSVQCRIGMTKYSVQLLGHHKNDSASLINLISQYHTYTKHKQGWHCRQRSKSLKQSNISKFILPTLMGYIIFLVYIFVMYCRLRITS